MVDIDKVLELVNCLDYREATRRYGPAWAVVVVTPALGVAAVHRYKQMPTASEIDKLMQHHPGCAYFYTQPEMYESVQRLLEKIQGCKKAFSIDWNTVQYGFQSN